METKKQVLYTRIVIGVLLGLFVLAQGWFAYGNVRAGSNVAQILGSILLLAVPLGILFGSIGVLLVARWEKHHLGAISQPLRKTLYRLPRVAGIFITFFVSLFALDVFTGEAPVWRMMAAFLVHLLPSFAMAIILVLAWKREWIGFLAFLSVAVFFLRFLFPNPLDQFGLLLLFSGPMAAVAVLFLVNWLWKKEIRE